MLCKPIVHSEEGGDPVSEPWWLSVQATAVRPSGHRGSMSDQVFRYDSMGEYLDPDITGTPVSAEFDTWEQAETVRDTLRQGEPRFYYNIQHTTAVAVIEVE